ncbi:MAG: HEPN domain-containing protein [Candidatus Thermoplasmatota archaeon]|nr:HEPN domain-containing protein [Candidatus Thermoplasmatota archaeon]
MVNRELASKALKNAEEWLLSAKELDKTKVPSKVLYSLEMGIEMSLKALLIYHGIDFPKSHNILPVVANLISSSEFDDTEIKKYSNELFSIFHALLDIRSASGYSYESSFDNEFFLEKANRYVDPAFHIFELIRKHINTENK